MTNVRNPALPQSRRLVEKPENRCIVPLTEFCEWSRDKDPEKGIKGEMWFACQARLRRCRILAGDRRQAGLRHGHLRSKRTRRANPKAMITILPEAEWDRWLNGSFEDVVALQRPYPADLMTERGPVFSTREKKV